LRAQRIRRTWEGERERERERLEEVLWKAKDWDSRARMRVPGREGARSRGRRRVRARLRAEARGQRRGEWR
jgi:hypothetical protein